MSLDKDALTMWRPGNKEGRNFFRGLLVLESEARHLIATQFPSKEAFEQSHQSARANQIISDLESGTFAPLALDLAPIENNFLRAIQSSLNAEKVAELVAKLYGTHADQIQHSPMFIITLLKLAQKYHLIEAWNSMQASKRPPSANA